VLLYRYSDQERITVVAPVCNQSCSEIDGLAKFLADNLVIHADLSGRLDFLKFLVQVHELVLEVSTDRELKQMQVEGLQQLADKFEGDKESRNGSLFPAMFIFEDTSGLNHELTEDKEISSDLILKLQEIENDGLQGSLIYNENLFDSNVISRMAEHLEILLERVVANPEQLIQTLPILTEAERHQLLVEWNNTQADYPKNKCVHQLFEEQVERTPNAIAAIFEEKQLSYQELNAQANQLAYYLQSLGVGPEVLVGLCIDRSIEMLVGLLGILKAGGAYVPLDPSYPLERLQFILKDSAVTVLLTQDYLLDRLPQHKAQFICFDQAMDDITKHSSLNLNTEIKSDNLAYIIYTSGSTGQPKGVMNLHMGICNRLQWMQDTYRLTLDDRVLQKTPFSFDVSIWEFFWPLIVGARLILAKPEGHKDSRYLADLIVQQEITTIHFVPSMLAAFLQDPHISALKCLKRVICSGEALSIQLQQDFFGKFDCDLYNLYGPTEAAIDVTAWSCKTEVENAIVPIGYPIANTQIYILNSQLQPVPVGVSGEIYIGGICLARGYLNRAGLTAEKFIINPFGEGRLYKTGDIARYLSNGAIEFLGRIDYQVKVRGFRVELGEIEAVLGKHSKIQQAVVSVSEDIQDHKQLVAYVAAKSGLILTNNELRSFLRHHLPDYMMPNIFMILDSLPLNANGKIDRNAMPKPEASYSELEETFVAPHTPTQRTLVEIWSKLLGVKRIGVQDDFFNLGGHSLIATQLISRIRDTFQLELPIHCIFENPTIQALAKMIEQDVKITQKSKLSPVRKVPRNVHLPVSFSQERVYFVQQLAPESIAYQAQSTIRFMGKLDAERVRQSLNEIVRRHEIFRTTFPTVDGQVVQVIHPFEAIEVPLIELMSFPEDKRSQEAQRLLKAEFQKQFDPTKLPLVRWILLRLSNLDHILVHLEHHFVHDGWSFNVFVGELVKLYKAFAEGQPSPLPELPIQFADFANWQRQLIHEKEAERQLAYWEEKLVNSPPLLELPYDRQRPVMQAYRGNKHRIEMPVSLCESLRSISRKEGVTLFMTMLTAFAILLHRYTQEKDICIGSTVANRRLHETEGLIGMIVNNIVLRINLSEDITFRELLIHVRQVTLEAYEHQDLPFEKIVEALQPARNLSYNPLFQVMFGFHDAPLPSLEIPGLDMEIKDALGNGSAKFDLNIVVIPRSEQSVGLNRVSMPQGITIVWEYNTDLFDSGTMLQMQRCYQTLLESIIADPSQLVSDLKLLDDVRQKRLLIEWNNTQAYYPQHKCIHQLFEKQVERTPDEIAIVFENQKLTYRELNSRSNQLAHHLKTMGVTSEVLVGICIVRSIEMMIGLLGILKAGGTYVPLDPTYPQERLAYILKDSQLNILLTQQQLLEKLPESRVTVICLDEGSQSFSNHSQDNLCSEVRPSNLAYVIYTSGSTGSPKGVMVTHSGVVNYLSWCIEAYNVADGEGSVVNSSISFDATITSLFSPLLVGRKVVLLPEEEGIEALKKALCSSIKYSLVKITPAHLEILSYLLDDEQLDIQTQAFIIGGEALSKKIVSFWQRYSPNIRLINEYGPTEAVVGCCTYEVKNETFLGENIPIGRPIANTKLYILDNHLQPVPIGVVGELYIGGACLARGYLNRPELTQNRFIANPFAQQQGLHLFKTGDLARYLPNGNIEFLGRIDYQVKVRGFRIELGEIEAVLGKHPKIQQAVVIVREDIQGHKQLVAYIVAKPELAPTDNELRSFLKHDLPDYMMPNIFMILESLPLNANGKIDRDEMPKPDISCRNIKSDFVKPRTVTEEMLANIWKDVLNLQQLSIQDNFFELGGHSLLAIQVISRIRQAFSVELLLHDLFKFPTVLALADHLETLHWVIGAQSTSSFNTEDTREEGEI